MDVYELLADEMAAVRRELEADRNNDNSVDRLRLTWTPSSTPVLAVYSEKGGVGKTALTTGLAAVMGDAGHRVLAIDLDPRATATDELGVDNPTYTVNDLLYVDPADDDPPDIRGAAADAIVPAGDGWPDTVHVIAAERALGHRESDPTPGIEQRLTAALSGVAENYDLVVMDVPPRAGGKLPAVAMMAATHAIVPATLDEDGYIGAADALRTMRRVRLSAGLPAVPVVGVLRHIVDRRRSELASTYDVKLSELVDSDGRSLLLPDVAVPRYVVRQEARTLRVPITASNSPEALAIRRAYTRVLHRVAEVA